MLFTVLVILATGPRSNFALQKGDSWTAEQTWHFVNKPASIDFENDEWVEYKVDSVDPDGYKLSVGTVLTKSRVDGYDVPAPKDQKPLVRTYKISREGWPVSQPAEADPRVARLNRLTFALIFPRLRSAQSWNDQGLPSQGIPTVLVNLITGNSTAVRTAQVQEQAIERPITGGGEITLDLETGIPMKAKLSFQNAPLPGGTELTDLFYNFKVTATTFRGRI